MPNQNNSLPRNLRDIVRKGTVAELAGDKVRVQVGHLLTNWIPWSNLRAGNVKVSSKPSIGEQVILLAENGNLCTASIIGYLNSTANPMPSDCGENDLVIDVPAGGRFVVRCGSSFIVMTENAITLNATRIDLN